LFGAFIINIEISTNRLTPYLLEDQDSSYYHWEREREGGDLTDVVQTTETA
jgi:hypothetical protein